MVYKLILQTELKMLNQALYLPMLTVLLSRATAGRCVYCLGSRRDTGFDADCFKPDTLRLGGFHGLYNRHRPNPDVR